VEYVPDASTNGADHWLEQQITTAHEEIWIVLNFDGFFMADCAFRYLPITPH